MQAINGADDAHERHDVGKNQAQGVHPAEGQRPLHEGHHAVHAVVPLHEQHGGKGQHEHQHTRKTLRAALGTKGNSAAPSRSTAEGWIQGSVIVIILAGHDAQMAKPLGNDDDYNTGHKAEDSPETWQALHKGVHMLLGNKQGVPQHHQGQQNRQARIVPLSLARKNSMILTIILSPPSRRT